MNIIFELFISLGLAGLGLGLIYYIFYKRLQELDRYNSLYNYIVKNKGV